MADLVELVLAGSKDAIRAFVSGYAAGEGLADDAILFAADNGVETESMVLKIAELVHLKESHEFLLAEELIAAALAAKIKEIGKPLQIAIHSRRAIQSASLSFSYDAYNRELGAKLERIIRELATQLTLSDDYKPDVEIDPEATGAELYSPAHNVEIHASGAFTGPVRGVIAARNRLLAEEMLQLEPIRLLP